MNSFQKGFIDAASAYGVDAKELKNCMKAAQETFELIPAMAKQAWTFDEVKNTLYDTLINKPGLGQYLDSLKKEVAKRLQVSPQTANAIIGAGGGGLTGLVGSQFFDIDPLESTLMGALAGGGLGYGLSDARKAGNSHPAQPANATPVIPPAAEPPRPTNQVVPMAANKDPGLSTAARVGLVGTGVGAGTGAAMTTAHYADKINDVLGAKQRNQLVKEHNQKVITNFKQALAYAQYQARQEMLAETMKNLARGVHEFGPPSQARYIELLNKHRYPNGIPMPGTTKLPLRPFEHVPFERVPNFLSKLFRLRG